jgi:lipopolysaccharide biosynthesis regulator YciM
MSVGRDKFILERKVKTMEKVICVYCEGVYDADVFVCPTCKEYDGMMPLVKGIEYLDLDPNDFD